MKLSRKPLLLPFLLFAAASLLGQVPGSTPQEAAVVERQVTRVRFENDGTSVRDTTTVVRIHSEAGVQRFGQLVEGYSSATEILEVDYVRVRKPSGEVIQTPKENAQDFAPEVLISAPMYSDYRQRHITVVGLRPGDLLEYHIISRTTTPLAAGEFWFEYSFPKGLAVHQERLDIDVPRGREITLKSPKRKYTTEDSTDRRTYTWVVENIKPEIKSLDRTPEEDESETQEEDAPEIQLTSFSSWQQVGLWYAKLQGERVIVNDAVRSKAVELTKGGVTPADQARRLYDYVARTFRYVSLSFGVGRLQPHAAPEIMKSGYGDCKDKHTLLSALLRAVGITSYPVLINSSRKLDRDVPSPAQFDHVITAVRIGNDLTWVDTTAEVAPFGLLMYSLRDKDALLAADDSNVCLRRTPSSVPVKNTMVYSMDGKVSETGTLDAVIELTATGDSDVPLRATLRRLSQADWERVAQALSSRDGVAAGKISEIDVGPLEDTSKPLHMRYRFHQDNYFRVPSANMSFFPFSAMGFPHLRARAKANEPLDVGPATELTQRVRLQFASNFSLRLPSDIVLSRDYAEFRSSHRVTNNLLEAERKLVLKVNELPASRRPDLESLRSVLLNIPAQTISCTIRPAPQATQATVASGGNPEDLRKAAAKAFQQGDFQAASELLRQVVEKEPTSKESWADLGRAYAGLNDHRNAISALQKQVEINPYHKRAYKDLGEELRQQGRYEEAIVAYRKQIDNVPLDAGAHKSLGLLLLQLKRDKEAIEQLEAAAAVPPDDAETKMALAQVYTHAGDAAKARPLLAAVVGHSAAYPTDLFAAALGEDSDREQSQRDARKLLDDIGEQFDSGAYAGNPPEVFSTMHYVALGWARLGWAKTEAGGTLEGLRYLEAAWILSQSASVANRMARVYEKTGQTAKAKHYLALAVAVGDQGSREKLMKLDGAGADSAIRQAQAELAASRTVKLTAVRTRTGSAEFNLVFDGSSKPEHAEFCSGDASLRDALDALVNASYPVMFPDVSSVKVVHRAAVSCGASGCTATLKALDAVQPAVRAVPVAALPKADAATQQK